MLHLEFYEKEENRVLITFVPIQIRMFHLKFHDRIRGHREEGKGKNCIHPCNSSLDRSSRETNHPPTNSFHPRANNIRRDRNYYKTRIPLKKPQVESHCHKYFTEEKLSLSLSLVEKLSTHFVRQFLKKSNTNSIQIKIPPNPPSP